jgi:hypothetical protein
LPGPGPTPYNAGRSCTPCDLTHAFNEQTLYWPTSPSSFRMKQLAHGHTEGGSGGPVPVIALVPRE